jgi:L-seryl-tRNA(Ser) seleniumtransferase
VSTPVRSPLPSVDEVLRAPEAALTLLRFGRSATTAQIRVILQAQRQTLMSGTDLTLAGPPAVGAAEIAAAAHVALDAADRPSQRRVFNLTGTVLHTNLGRAVLAEVAIEAVVMAMRGATNLEYALNGGARGERDDHVRGLIRELTGAPSAIVVNNAAAAVQLVLAALAKGRETIVSRGELIEIGGAFRLPAIMASAGTRLVEVGTTNRTHLRDYAEAIGPKTALLMKVHTSNYKVQGFTAEVAPRELSGLARARNLPFVDDLGSGTLVDLSRWGLARERMVQDALADGADLVIFSGDKLLGGPQAGIIAGRGDLVARCAKHPLKRAMRLDKLRLAALEATLKLYRDPDRLPERLPTLRAFTRSRQDLRLLAQRLLPVLQGALGARWSVEIIDCSSQIGSGALPLETMPSAALACRSTGKRSGRALDDLARRLRGLFLPVIGRISEERLVLDLRCLDDEAGFVAVLAELGARNAVATA